MRYSSASGKLSIKFPSILIIMSESGLVGLYILHLRAEYGIYSVSHKSAEVQIFRTGLQVTFLVPTRSVGTPLRGSTSCVEHRTPSVPHGLHSHAERGNDEMKRRASRTDCIPTRSVGTRNLILVPTLRVGTSLRGSTSCVEYRTPSVPHGLHSHAERGNEKMTADRGNEKPIQSV
jgi:hypothetical protein